MRWMRDVVALLGAAALVGGYLYIQREQRDKDALVGRAESDLRRMDLEVKYRAASKSTELNSRGWPVTIDPAWFEDRAPDNPLVDHDRPWVEVAGTQQADFIHPPVRMTIDRSLASFWYNPYQGIVRARVPVMVSDDEATTLYNRINGTVLTSIFSRETPTPSVIKPVNEAKQPTDKPFESAPVETKPTRSLFSIFKSEPKRAHRKH
ncbi:MAG: hypothetical protein IT438_03090 [Phycisphaerales bacterium]|nr:hypothetical protein [Phycisphaerales bacterium]